MMKELTTRLTAQQIFTLGRAAKEAGFATLEEYAAALLIRRVEEFEKGRAA